MKYYKEKEIYEEQSFKNYKEFCAYFDLKVTSGLSKNKQIDDFSRYALFVPDSKEASPKNKRFIIIRCVYNKPLERSIRENVYERFPQYLDSIYHYSEIKREAATIFIEKERSLELLNKHIEIVINEMLTEIKKDNTHLDSTYISEFLDFYSIYNDKNDKEYNELMVHGMSENQAFSINSKQYIVAYNFKEESYGYQFFVFVKHYEDMRIKKEFEAGRLSRFLLSNYPPSNTEKLLGIYCIMNVVNQRKYIGSSINIHKRVKEHKENLSLNCHHNYKLQNDFNEFGEDKFLFLILEIEKYTYELPRTEMNWIRLFGGLWSEKIYNMSDPLKETAVIEMRNNM